MDTAASIPFIKYQSIGNDFVLIDANEVPIAVQDEPSLAKQMCDRYTGIGSDGLIILRGIEMIFLNPDGTYDVCGNGMRCVGHYLARKKSLSRFTIDTAAGKISVETLLSDRAEEVLIQTIHPVSTVVTPWSADGYQGWLVNPGTPHFCILTEDVTNPEIPKIGARLEHTTHPEYAVTVDFIQKDFAVLPHKPFQATIRIWERSVGETLGCGTAALAVSAVLHLLHPEVRDFEIASKGGTISSRVNPDNSKLVAAATSVFSGVYRLLK